MSASLRRSTREVIVNDMAYDASTRRKAPYTLREWREDKGSAGGLHSVLMTARGSTLGQWLKRMRAQEPKGATTFHAGIEGPEATLTR